MSQFCFKECSRKGCYTDNARLWFIIPEKSVVRVWFATPSQYYPQTTAPDMVKMAEKEIPGVVLDHKREWRQQKRDLVEGTIRGGNSVHSIDALDIQQVISQSIVDTLLLRSTE